MAGRQPSGGLEDEMLTRYFLSIVRIIISQSNCYLTGGGERRQDRLYFVLLIGDEVMIFYN